MENVRNVDVLVSIMDCADDMLHDIDDDETMLNGFATLRKLCFMLPNNLVDFFGGIDLSKAIDDTEDEYLSDGDIDTLIVLVAKIYSFGSAASKMYKLLAAPAFTEVFNPVAL